MSWKINSVTMTNFKFFHQPFTFSLEGRNLLVYGENGSGKSSIYWALYTLFQSRNKTVAEVRRYFDSGNHSNLRNRYSLARDSSSISIEFQNFGPHSPVVAKTYTISNSRIETQSESDSFFEMTDASSDFLNYKNLTSLTDFRNSQNNDVFSILEKEIFPYADFTSGYFDIQIGQYTQKRKAKQWWDYIQQAVSLIPKRKNGELNKKSFEYRNYQHLRDDFCKEIKIFLANIAFGANMILHDKFGISDLNLMFRPDKVLKIDKKGKLQKYEVNMWAQIVNAEMQSGRRTLVNHLRTFFNEAKLTCIGLAIRLAVVDSKFVAGDSGASVLIVDDILISLEMGYRIPVIKTLLEYATRGYQLCIFTHDRAFYEMLKRLICSEGLKATWIYKEMYASSNSLAHLYEPRPIMLSGKEDENVVECYMNNHDYPAAANAMRKLAEKYLHSLLPMNLWYQVGKECINKKMLSSLFTTSRSAAFRELYDFTLSELPNIQPFIERLMNPLSHDDKDIPIYRQELERCLGELEKYKPLIDAKKIIVPRLDVGKETFNLHIDSNGQVVDIDFIPIEQWDFFDLPTRRYKNCDVQIQVANGIPLVKDFRIRIKNLYKNVCKQLSLGAENVGFEFEDVIRNQASGKYLKDY